MVVALAVLAGCGRLGFDAPGDTIGDGSQAGSGYHATAVRFTTAANNYLYDAALLNTGDSPSGTLSVWIHFTGGDGVQQSIAVGSAIGGLFRTATNQFRFYGPSCLTITVVNMYSAGRYTTSSGWVHLLAAWDGATGSTQIYVNDVSDLAAGPTVTNGAICYASTPWGIGGTSAGALNADVADFYANLGTFIDLSVTANRRKFDDGNNKPIDLGSTCSNPTGSPPTACFVGAPASWPTNKGIAGGFTDEGPVLTLAPTSPSD
jgi:hypothetical protein